MMGLRFKLQEIPITVKIMGLCELPLRANLTSANYILSSSFFFSPSSSSHFFPQQSLCVASGMGWPPKGPEVVLLGAGARWLPQGCLKRARLKLPRVFEAAAFEAVGLEAGACV